MAARPPADTNRTHACTFGPIDPSGNSPAASSSSASATVTVSRARASGVPKPTCTRATSVRISSASAPTDCASRAALRSLSTTASTPRSWPRYSTTGTPPPPPATTT